MKTRRRFLQTAAVAALPTSRARAANDAGADFVPTLFELRSYVCEPGRRDELIAMFEDVFLDAYQAGGARIVASFRHLGDADRWLWMRGFRSAADRRPALKAFYGSAAWKARADACNATIRDISPALLLREAGATSFASLEPAPRAGGAAPGSRYLVEIYPLVDGSDAQFSALFEREALPVLGTLGARPRATFVTDGSENSFPHQPVRAGSTFVSLTRFANAAALASLESARKSSTVWRDRVAPALGRLLAAPIEVHRLQPTARSALR